MSLCHECSNAQSVGQLRAVLWSMRAVIAATRDAPRPGKAWLFELHSLADAGIRLADLLIDEWDEAQQ